MTAAVDSAKKKCDFVNALDITGFGKYSIAMLCTCCLLMLAMYVDIFSFSVVMPALACDMELTTAQQGLLSAMPLIGVMISSYGWGLCADTRGRRATLLLAMPLGVIFSFVVSLAPNFWSLAVLKFLSASFTASANAAGVVLLGESVPQRYRSRMMFLMATTTMIAQLVICLFALPIFSLSFRINVLGLEYRPWRLLMQALCLPGALGCVCIYLMNESPKFLLCIGKEEEAIALLKTIYNRNTGKKEKSFPMEQVFLDDLIMSTSTDTSLLRKMWHQTALLFKPPLLKNSLKLYYLLLCAFMTCTGYTMWVPAMTNAYFSDDEVSGRTFCEVVSKSTGARNSTVTDCDNAIETNTLYATMVYSGMPGVLTILLSFIVGSLGKKKTIILVFTICLVCGILLLFIRIPLLSIGLFFMFLYVVLILGSVNTYLVDLNPTHLGGMATCLSVVVARGSGFISVQLIAVLLGDYCTPMICGYIVLVMSGLLVSFFLPPESKGPDAIANAVDSSDTTNQIKDNTD